MKTANRFLVLTIVIMVLAFVACDKLTSPNNKTPDLGKSLDPVEEVTLIKEAENSTLTVNINSKKEAYFSVDFANITSNPIIENGLWDAWCIDVNKSINSNDGVYNNIKLYSTDRVEKWMSVNYLLNIQEELQNTDPDITWLEIQLVIWSLRANPEFDLEEVALEDLPGQFRSDGQPTFNAEKVNDILGMVEANYPDFDFDKRGSKFAVIAEMPVDVQTIITVVEVK